MKIDQIDVYHVHMNLKSPFNTAFGDTHAIETVLVRMSSGDAYGWGEGAPWRLPAYSSENGFGAYDVVHRFLGPAVVGKTFDTGQSLQDAMAFVKGNYFAKAAVDTAWWDLQARLADKPLWQLIGGKGPEVEVGADFGVMSTVEELIEDIHRSQDAGFKRVKLKYRPGWELDMIRRVRKTFPDVVFHVDCNSAYTLENKDMLLALDEFNLAMVEQPLMHDDLIDHATLQRQLKTPICLDESITSVTKARQAIDIGACSWINIKPSRVGGVTNAIAIHDYCQSRNIPVWIGGMLESAVGASHCLALGTLPNVKYPSDIFPSDRFYKADLSQPPLEINEPSVIKASKAAGVGAEPDARQLERETVHAARIKPE